MSQDDARNALSQANGHVIDAAHKVWAAQAEYDQAEADGDPFEILHTLNALLAADEDHAEAVNEREEAEAALVAAAEKDGEW